MSGDRCSENGVGAIGLEQNDEWPSSDPVPSGNDRTGARRSAGQSAGSPG